MNRKHPALIVAVAAVTGIGVTAFSVTAQDQSDAQQQRQDRQQQQDRLGEHAQDQQARQAQKPELPQGVEQKGEADVSDVREVFGEVANAAAGAGGFDDIVERFVDQDRNRFGEWFDEAGDEFTELNTAADGLRRVFEEKYPDQDLSIDGETAFASINVIQGEVTNPEQVATNWPVKADAGMAEGETGEARLAGAEQDGQLEQTGDQSNIEEGRTVAVAAVSGMKEKQTLHVSLVNEFPSAWKIDVPNDRKPEQVYRDLTQRIEKLAENTEKWPETAEKAKQVVAYEVLAAIYGVDAEKNGQQGRDEVMPQRDLQDQRQRDDSMPR